MPKGPNLFAGMQHAADSGNLTEPSLSELPVTLLESFIPGFGLIRRFLIATLGFDITLLASSLFILFALVAGSHYVWKAAFSFWEDYLTSSITINSSDKLYEQVMQWVSRNSLTKRAKSLSASTSTKSNQRGDMHGHGPGPGASRGPLNSNSEGTAFTMEWEENTIYTPYYGTHFLWFNGRLFILRREKSRQNDISVMIGNGVEEKETIRLATFGRSSAPIKALLQQCKKDFAMEKRAMTTIRAASIQRGSYWHTATTRLSRPLDTVYLDSKIKENLLEDVCDFLSPASPKYYSLRGIPYRRGYLFHGPPGTGKTSLSLALAGLLGLDLHILSLSERELTDEKLSSLFSGLPDHCIVLLEDIDTVGLERREDIETGREKEEKKDEPDAGRRPRGRGGAGSSSTEPKGVSLSGVLNAIDGVASPEGRVLVMTTNNPESLDQALIRPGRVDMQVYFGNVNEENARQIFTRMFTADSDLVEDDREALNRRPGKAPTTVATTTTAPGLTMTGLDQLAIKFAEALPNEKFTPAEVQGFLLSRRKSPQKAIEEVPAWRDELLAAKASGKNIIAPKSGSRKNPAADGNTPDRVEGRLGKKTSKPNGINVEFDAITTKVNGTMTPKED